MTNQITYTIEPETVLTFCSKEHVHMVWAMSSSAEYCHTCSELIDNDNVHILEGTVTLQTDWNDSEPLPFGIER